MMLLMPACLSGPGAAVSQEKSGNTFKLTITSKLLVPRGGDVGQLSVQVPELDILDTQQVVLEDPGAGSADQSDISSGPLEASVATVLLINESSINLW
jgi:hypothetical protein